MPSFQYRPVLETGRQHTISTYHVAGLAVEGLAPFDAQFFAFLLDALYMSMVKFTPILEVRS